MDTSKEVQRWEFVEAWHTGLWSLTELCERYGISRPTGYKWIERFAAGSIAGGQDRSRAPATCPHRTPPAVEQALLALRTRDGAYTSPNTRGVPPARSTVNAILNRHGLLRKNRRRRRWQHPGRTPLHTVRPNQVWPADFKGHFKLATGQ